jgi:D-alanyl-D-alanine carboxypeptidase/D-alanyl-D-alanine-endopeptidase (penicillin-binding protein 4)
LRALIRRDAGVYPANAGLAAADARSTAPARSVGVSKWLAALLIAAFWASALAQNAALMPAPNPAPGPRVAAPEPYLAALRSANIPASSVGMVIQPISPAGGGLAPSALNETLPLNPASAMKLVTTYAALNLLGPAYTWKTEAFAVGALRGSTLDGDLALRGSGDPKLVVEHLWLLAHRIRGVGVQHIRGDVLLDKSAFAAVGTDPAAFDGEGLRPYNAGPDALLLNYKSVAFGFVPDPETRSARVVATPPLAGLQVPLLVRGTDGPCGDWRARLQGDFSQPMAPQFRGAFPLACGERVWHVSVLDHNQYLAAVFRALWEGAGGTWSGRVREAAVPAEARRIALHESEPLASVIRDINKFSNNVMTRQLYLTLGAEATRQPGSPENAERAVRAWLVERGLEMPELVLENGAGLSRIERISAASLARLLQHAFASPLMPEYVSSLPLAGVDGTLRRRPGAAGNAHVKTGLLVDVRAIAGYVHAQSGRRYVVVSIINHPNARDGQPAHDALLDWVFRHG